MPLAAVSRAPRSAWSVWAGRISALPDAGTALLFLLTWIAPRAIQPRMVADLALVMLLEFFVVHSAGFLGAVQSLPGWRRGRRLAAMAGLGLFYTLLLGGFCLAEGVFWPLAAFWGLIANRMLAVWLDPPPAERAMMSTGALWAAAAASYLLSVGLTTALPLPALGITAAVVAEQGFAGSGLWLEQPQTVLAAGALHFALQAGVCLLRARIGAAGPA